MAFGTWQSAGFGLNSVARRVGMAVFCAVPLTMKNVSEHNQQPAFRLATPHAAAMSSSPDRNLSTLNRQRGTRMPHVLIIHEVEAYPAWKTVFDEAAEIRKTAGEIHYQLLRYADDTNRVVHFSEWSSLDSARRFFESAELVAIRQRAGVKAPEFLYLNEIERGTL